MTKEETITCPIILANIHAESWKANIGRNAFAGKPDGKHFVYMALCPKCEGVSVSVVIESVNGLIVDEPETKVVNQERCVESNRGENV